jgi:methionine--tRNA ligase beta chain
MAQIFLGKDRTSRAVDIMARYTRAIDADLVKITEVTPEQQKVLEIATVPCMIVTEAGKTFKCASAYAIFRHIAELTKFEKIFFGRTELENQQVLSYFELVKSLDTEELAELLNNDLKLRMFLVSYNITAADILAFSHLAEYVGELKDFEKVEKNNLFRWIDHVQNLPGIEKYVSSHNLSVSFPDESAKQPSKRELKKMAKKAYTKENKGNKEEGKKQDDKKQEDKKQEEKKETKAPVVEEIKKEEKKTEKNTTQDSAAPAKKEKKPKQKQNKPAKVEYGEPITQLDMRVGQIKKVWKHPESTSLYCEEIDIGEDEPRQIASGLQLYVKEEEMQDAMVVVLANLKPRKLANFMSNGMVMCAETPDKSAVELLHPPTGSKPGDLITVKGYERNCPEKMNPKKKIFESVVDDLIIDENGIAKFKDAEWVTDNGTIVATTIRNGVIH